MFGMAKGASVLRISVAIACAFAMDEACGCTDCGIWRSLDSVVRGDIF